MPVSKKKKNTKVKKTVSKPVTIVKPVNKPVNNVNSVITNYSTKVCGLSDPFCSHANGAKYPDDSSYRTITLTRIKSDTIISGSGANYTYNLFLPQLGYSPMATATVASGTTVTSWGNFPSTSVVGMQAYRTISFGMKLSAIAAPLYRSGVVRIRGFAFEEGANLASVDLATYYCSFAYDIPYDKCNDVAIIFPRTAQRPEQFYDALSDSSSYSTTTKGFGFVTIMVEGGPPGTSLLNVTSYHNLEFIPDDTSVYSMLATPPPRKDALLTDVAGAITSSIKPVFKEGVSAFSNAVTARAKQMLSKHLSAAVRNAVPLLLT